MDSIVLFPNEPYCTNQKYPFQFIVIIGENKELIGEKVANEDISAVLQ